MSLDDRVFQKIGGPHTCCGAAQVVHVGKTCEQVLEERRTATRARFAAVKWLPAGYVIREEMESHLADNIDTNG